MKIVAFLQNPWFPPGTDFMHISRYKNDDDFRRRVLARSKTGRRLMICWGPDWFSRIIWDNVCPEAGTYSRYKGIPSTDHVAWVIERHDPHVVITYGRLATETLCKYRNETDSGERFVMFDFAHPNAMGQTRGERDGNVREVLEWMKGRLP